MPFPHFGEEAGKHVFAVDAIMKAMLSRLDRGGNVVKGRMKNEIAEPPTHEIVARNRLEFVLLCHPAPEKALVGHIDFK